jgi:hypothetical protein
MSFENCECATWGTDCLIAGGHHYKCDHFDVKPLIAVISALLDGMEAWALDEDGIHPEAWDAYVAGRHLLCRPVQWNQD